MTWWEDIREALKDLGGIAHLSDIYHRVEFIQKKRGKKKIKTFNDTINGILEKNSRGMGRDIFYSANGILNGSGDGYWGLKDQEETI